jgi:hypothetical protein
MALMVTQSSIRTWACETLKQTTAYKSNRKSTNVHVFGNRKRKYDNCCNYWMDDG